jgi:pyruvate dehydrogenase E2 component (dihydrolipoamide acetyltransferase)
MAEDYIVRSLSPLRKIIAERMSQANREIPHFRISADIEFDAMIALRSELSNLDGQLSLTDPLIKACATALVETPAVNLQWAEKQLHQYQGADISVVVAIKGGLSTPVIRHAESKSVFEISRDIKDLTARALSNTLKINEIQGGSFSISNLGMYGVDQFDAIINPPQCAILAIATAKKRLVLSAQGEPRIATVARVTLSCDHRAIDGSSGAMFLSALKACVEQPERLRPASVKLG